MRDAVSHRLRFFLEEVDHSHRTCVEIEVLGVFDGVRVVCDKFVDDFDDIVSCDIEIDDFCGNDLIIGRFSLCDEFVELCLISVEAFLLFDVVGDCVEIGIDRAHKARLERIRGAILHQSEFVD